jgi:hypothetical protein
MSKLPAQASALGINTCANTPRKHLQPPMRPILSIGIPEDFLTRAAHWISVRKNIRSPELLAPVF